MDCWIAQKNAHTQVLCGAKKFQRRNVSSGFTVEDCTEIWDILGCSPTHEVSAEASDWNHFHNILQEKSWICRVALESWVGKYLNRFNDFVGRFQGSLSRTCIGIEKCVWFIIHERSQLHPKTHPCSLCESSLPIMKMNGKCIVRFPFRSLREASRPSARESYKFIPHRWQVSSKMASKTSSKMTSLKRPLVSRSTPLQVLGVRYTIQWPACCESKTNTGPLQVIFSPMKHGRVPSGLI